MSTNEPSKDEYIDAAINPDMTPEEKAAIEEIKADLNAQLMEIFHRVSAEVEAEQRAAVKRRGAHE